MQIKDILLHVDASPAYGRRLHTTLLLARAFEAHVIGISVLPDHNVVALAQGSASAKVASELLQLESAAAQLGDDFMAALRRDHLPGEWRTARGPADIALARNAHAADLVVLGQNDPHHTGDLAAPEDVVIICGRPALIVPFAGHFDELGKQIIIAWNGSREATRTAQAALPLMAASGVVTVFSAKSLAETECGNRCAELVQHLERHNLKVRSESVVLDDEESVAEKLQLRALSLGADLIVMGAFGRSRLRETILGGTTRDMLDDTTRDMLDDVMTPVMMGH